MIIKIIALAQSCVSTKIFCSKCTGTGYEIRVTRFFGIFSVILIYLLIFSVVPRWLIIFRKKNTLVHFRKIWWDLDGRKHFRIHLWTVISSPLKPLFLSHELVNCCLNTWPAIYKKSAPVFPSLSHRLFNSLWNYDLSLLIPSLQTLDDCINYSQLWRVLTGRTDYIR